MSNNLFFYKNNRKLVPINVADVILIESHNNTALIHTHNNIFPAYQRLHELEASFPDAEFCRVHRRYIVCMKKITSINRFMIIIAGMEIPIGPTYYREFLRKLTIIN